jgi:hypothetical protein
MAHVVEYIPTKTKAPDSNPTTTQINRYVSACSELNPVIYTLPMNTPNFFWTEGISRHKTNEIMMIEL